MLEIECTSCTLSSRAQLAHISHAPRTSHMQFSKRVKIKSAENKLYQNCERAISPHIMFHLKPHKTHVQFCHTSCFTQTPCAILPHMMFHTDRAKPVWQFHNTQTKNENAGDAHNLNAQSLYWFNSYQPYKTTHHILHNTINHRFRNNTFTNTCTYSVPIHTRPDTTLT
jgi:hypothetical protein